MLIMTELSGTATLLATVTAIASLLLQSTFQCE
jgi:hypothetical protein